MLQGTSGKFCHLPAILRPRTQITINAGTSVTDSSAAAAMENVFVNASGLNNRPSCDSSAKIGRNDTAITSSEKNKGRPTSLAAATTTSTQPRTQVEQIQELAERAILVPVGASILAQENLVSTVKGLATKYRSRASLERELKRYERRGATARNRFERQVRKTRTRFERELRQRTDAPGVH